MKTTLLRFPLLLLSLLATREVRGEFNPALVAGDSRWVVYVDLATLRESAVGKQLMSAANKVQPTLGGSIHIDVAKVLGLISNVTAYGANFKSKDPHAVDGSLVIQGTPELRKVAEALLIEANLAHPETVVEVKTLGFDAYAISPPQGQTGQHLVIAFPPEPIVLISKSEEQLRKAHALFLGRDPSIARNASSPLTPLLANAAHAMLFAASVVPSDQLFPQNAPQARILQMANSGSVAVGEDGAKTFAHVQLAASSGEMADKLEKILQGMAAMMSLGESSDQELNAFLNSAVVGRLDQTVTLQLDYASDRLAQMLQRMMQNAPVRSPGGPNREFSIGKVAATWTTPAAAPDSGEAPEAVLHTIPDVALVNGSAITFEVVRATPGSQANFDQVRIIPKDAPAGTSAGLVFSRKIMTEVHRPILRVVNGTTRWHSYRQFYFPGESGTYTLEVRVTPSAKGEATLSVGVSNPQPEGDSAAEPARDDASHSNGRP